MSVHAAGPATGRAAIAPRLLLGRDRDLAELPGLDAFGALIFQVAGQQLSVRSTRAILSRLAQSFGGRLPSPAELLAAAPQVLRASGFSGRKAETLSAVAERFVDGRLSDEFDERR